MNISVDQLLTLALFTFGGLFTLVGALVSYIFNSRLKDLDRRLRDGQNYRKGDIDALAKEVHSMKVDITNLIISVNSIRPPEDK